MTDQRWDTWIDWDNGSKVEVREMESSFSLEAGSVNFAYDPRFWHAEHLPATVECGLTYWLGPGLVLLSRFVLPILGCGNDP